MTPFGEKLRALRESRNLAQKDLAEALGLSPAYLSALEHGHRGLPGPGLIIQICGLLELDWEEAEQLKSLANRSKPKVTLDTGGLSPNATELANLLVDRIDRLSEADLAHLIREIQSRTTD